MKIIQLSQTDDREAWLDQRRGKATGTKDITPLTRKLNGTNTPAEFFNLLAERISVETDGEPPLERGHRLEAENIARTVKTLKLKKAKADAGVWVSSDDPNFTVSPDAYEDTDNPKWAIECKSFDSKKHIAIVLNDLYKQGKLDTRYSVLFSPMDDEYSAFNSVPKTNQTQILQYFAINDSLKVVYWALYDELNTIEGLRHYVIPVYRKDVDGLVEYHKCQTLHQLRLLNELVSDLTF